MKAIIISSYGVPEVLTVTELPDPVPAAGEVLIAVRAFGLNHAEAYMRSGFFGEVAEVTGIECAGTVVADLVAVPEVYATAWAGLRQNLDLRPGQTVLIRGATSALGQAAVNVAAELR